MYEKEHAPAQTLALTPPGGSGKGCGTGMKVPRKLFCQRQGLLPNRSRPLFYTPATCDYFTIHYRIYEGKFYICETVHIAPETFRRTAPMPPGLQVYLSAGQTFPRLRNIISDIMKKFTIYFAALLLSIPFLASCDDDDENENITVTTAAVTEITDVSAKTGGVVAGESEEAVTSRGVCWSTSANPTTEDFSLTSGSGKGSFTLEITGLEPSTTYYVRAYAVVGSRTLYGNQLSFATTEESSAELPEVTTSAVESVTAVSASSGGVIADAGSSPLTACGVCWSTSENPTTDDQKTTDTPEGNVFTSNITGLEASTTYYVRAYATNGEGTAYGQQLTFTTAAQGYDEGVSNLTGDVEMPAMSGDGMMECLGDMYGVGLHYWSIIIYNVGKFGLPDNQFMLEIHTETGDMETVPPGRYSIALQKDQAEKGTAEPGNVYNGTDYGCWYYADEGQGEFTDRASAVGGLGFVEIELLSGSGEMARYAMEVEMYDTFGNKITGSFEGDILNFSASGTRAAGYDTFCGTKLRSEADVARFRARAAAPKAR